MQNFATNKMSYSYALLKSSIIIRTIGYKSDYVLKNFFSRILYRLSLLVSDKPNLNLLERKAYVTNFDLILIT